MLHDWELVAQELKSAKADGNGEWVTVAEDATHHGIAQRARAGGIPELSDLDVEVQTRAVSHESPLYGRAWDIFMRIRA